MSNQVDLHQMARFEKLASFWAKREDLRRAALARWTARLQRQTAQLEREVRQSEKTPSGNKIGVRPV